MCLANCKMLTGVAIVIGIAVSWVVQHNLLKALTHQISMHHFSQRGFPQSGCWWFFQVISCQVYSQESKYFSVTGVFLS